MKRLAKILLSIFLIVPSILGMCFVSPKVAQDSALITSNGGGGASSLGSPKTGESSDFIDNKNDVDLSEDNEGENSTWDTPTYKTYEDYFTDYNITAETITEQDLTGRGTMADPYLVHSTRGFLYIFKSINLENKFLELACDIYLNEEVFDENGYPNGGDGVVYNWEPKTTGTNLKFDGNGFSIKGLFCKEGYYNVQGLFSSNIVLNEVSNVVMDNFFITGSSYCYSLCFNANTIKNCKNKRGTIIQTAGQYCAALASFAQNVEGCENYANIVAKTSHSGGIISCLRASGYIKNCNNYGEINGRYGVGGIVGYGASNIKITNCNNYGKISGTDLNVAGIIAVYYNHKSTQLLYIDNCVNFGYIYTQYSVCAGILALADGNVVLNKCKNFGLCQTYEIGKAREFVDQIASQFSKDKFSLSLIDCEANSTSGVPMFDAANGSSATACNIVVKNCKILVDTKIETNTFFVFGSLSAGSGRLSVDVDGLYVENSSLSTQLTLTSFLYDNVDYNLKNLIINNSENTQTNSFLYSSFVGKAKTNLHIWSMLCLSNGRKIYYGTDFSGFYIDWKTGEIGLKALSGKGLFQGELSEQILINKGFEKQ